MGKLDKYNIDLKGMKEDSCELEFILDDEYFSDLDAPEISRGDVNVDLHIRKIASAFELTFHTKGIVQIPCDRCLDDMDQLVETDDRLMVKLGTEYAEEDDLVIIPEDEGIINVAWFVYEFIALNIPLKHTHALGECNQEMMKQLNRHLTYAVDDEINEGNDISESHADDSPIDPRWNELKKILDNN